MPNNLTENITISSSNILTTQIQQFQSDNILKKEVSNTQDTITSTLKKEGKQVSVGQRPSLPAASKSKDTNYFMVLAEAFSKAFDSMSEATISQSKSYAQLQDLDQTMSRCVLDSTKISIDKEEKNIKISSELKSYAKKTEKEDKILEWTGIAVVAVVIIVTFVSGFFDLGASDAAIPEEVEGEGALAGGLSGAGEGAGDVELTDFSSFAEDSGSEATNNTSKLQSVAKTVGSKLLKVGLGVTLGSPMLMKGLQGLKTASMDEDAANAEAQVGGAVSKMQANNAYFKFYQELLQRVSGVVGEEANDASEVIDTFSGIAHAYQSIPTGLANAV